MSIDQRRIERMGRADFSQSLFLDSRRQAWEALYEVAAAVRPGMTEPDVQALLSDSLARRGSEKPWHRPIVRLGADTLKLFTPRSDETLRLAENDIFFLDIGPVWQGYEADVGDSFTLGEDREMARCAADCRALFGIVRDHWAGSGCSGAALYDFAGKQAAALGWELLLDVDGHRLGDFPHHAHYRGGLGDIDFHPAAAVWVLEIQIRHPSRRFGAFYEDLLMAEAS